jgi:hypothetical protein
MGGVYAMVRLFAVVVASRANGLLCLGQWAEPLGDQLEYRVVLGVVPPVVIVSGLGGGLTMFFSSGGCEGWDGRCSEGGDLFGLGGSGIYGNRGVRMEVD